MDFAEHIKAFLGEGYTVYDVLTSEEAKTVADTAIARACNIYLQGNKEVGLFLDADRRKQLLRPTQFCGEYSIAALYTKSTGYVNSYFASWILDLHTNKTVVDVVSHLYDTFGHEQVLETKKQFLDYLKTVQPHLLGYIDGPGRYYLKIRGCTDDKKRLGRQLFAEKDCCTETGANRIQTILYSSVDTTIKVRDSGILEVLPRFHLYWDVISML